MKDIPLDTLPHLFWPDTRLDAHSFMPSTSLFCGEHVHVTCPEPQQCILLTSWFAQQSEMSLHVVQQGKQLKCVGGAVAVVLDGRALLANISIQENIMLPFLYHHDVQKLNYAQAQLQTVAATLGLNKILHEKAGLRSPLVHALVGLSRVMLQQASFVILQQPFSSMDKQETITFTRLVKDVVKSSGLGMVYLTASTEDQADFEFTHYVHTQQYGENA